MPKWLAPAGERIGEGQSSQGREPTCATSPDHGPTAVRQTLPVQPTD